jgi:hypothetical protein
MPKIQTACYRALATAHHCTKGSQFVNYRVRMEFARTEECRSCAEDYEIHSENDVGAVFHYQHDVPIYETTLARARRGPAKSTLHDAFVLYRIRTV